jgi:COP9 signalosome complex subunit 12
MPSLEAFPMAHQVTYKYYVGVIYFLEENYAEVSLHDDQLSPRLTIFLG